MIKKLFLAGRLLAAVALVLPTIAQADERADCAAGDGTLLVGTVIAKPAFVGGKSLKGILLTHTHIHVRGDADGKVYDLAVDDVFATGYDPLVPVVPEPLSSITIGQHLEACGLPYAGGMHWVHTNCGDAPTPQDPDGWLRVVDSTGAIGPNLEGSQKYCYLWPRNGASHARHHRGRSPNSV